MRVKLEEQEKYEFTSNVMVCEEHLSEVGHVGYDSVVLMIGTARVNLLKTLGFTQLSIGEPQTGIIMRDLAVTYHEEGSLADEVTIGSHIGEITRSSLRLFHRLTRKGRIMALGETGLSCFNYGLHKVARIPDAFLRALELYEAQNR